MWSGQTIACNINIRYFHTTLSLQGHAALFPPPSPPFFSLDASVLLLSSPPSFSSQCLHPLHTLSVLDSPFPPSTACRSPPPQSKRVLTLGQDREGTWERKRSSSCPDLTQQDSPHIRYSPAVGACLGWNEATWTLTQMLFYCTGYKPGREVARIPSSCSSSKAFNLSHSLHMHWSVMCVCLRAILSCLAVVVQRVQGGGEMTGAGDGQVPVMACTRVPSVP